MVLAMTMLLVVREALALSKKEGLFKDITEGSDRRSTYRGNKYHQRFKPKHFNPDNAAAVMYTSTSDAAAAVVAIG